MLSVLLGCAFVWASQSASDFVPGVKLDALGLDELTAEKLKTGAESEKYTFQAEVNRMMKLIIHSLYKTKEIFLRELISNASDALDKIRFQSLTDKNSLGSAFDFNVTIWADKDRKTVNIRDTGIGMTKEQLVKNLGTIAKSGTSEFLNALESSADTSNLIGQFGVGFYSAFLVADKVTVVSKHNNDKQYIWESDAESDFTVVEDPRGDTLGRGTHIILHMRDDSREFLNNYRLETLIKKYSEFINFPIFLLINKTESIEVPLEGDELEKQIAKEAEEQAKLAEENAKKESDTVSDAEEKKEDEAVVEEVVEDDKSPAIRTKKVDRKVPSWEIINGLRPIWQRDPKSVSYEEYTDFYRAYTRDIHEPTTFIHFKAEGDVVFRALVYVPGKSTTTALKIPDDHTRAVKLFVRRVFITDEMNDFIPRWLGFVKGLVDSDDLPLNVSRETLQQHRTLELIKRKLVRKMIELFKSLVDDTKKWNKFWREYGTNIKLGCIEDNQNREKLAELLRYHSNASENKTSLTDYVTRMKKGQNQIYYLTGASLKEIKKSPFIERLVARGYEVLYMDDPIDEYLVQTMTHYQKFPFQNVAKNGLKFGDEDDEEVKRKEQETDTKFKPLVEQFKKVLDEHVEKVLISNRLTTSPCAIIANTHDWTGNMERMLSAQALATGNDPIRILQAANKRDFEINPYHPVILKLLDDFTGVEQLDRVDEVIQVLYELTYLRSGYMLKDTADFANRVDRMIKGTMGIPMDATPVLDDIKPAQEKETEEEPVKNEDEVNSPKNEEVVAHDEL